MLYKVDPKMTVAEIGLMKAKKVTEIESFIKSDIIYDEGILTQPRLLYVAYRMFCKRNNVFAIRKGELWHVLEDLGYTIAHVDGKPYWFGLKCKYIKVNRPFDEEEEEVTEDA